MGKTKKLNQASKHSLFIQPREFFTEIVRDALARTKLTTTPPAETYLIGLLENFVSTDKLFEIEPETGQRQTMTLAEMFLKAINSQSTVQIELFKKLGDTSLYISGFFGDSLNRKVVDIDYYAEMGGTAYQSLAQVVRDDNNRCVFGELSTKFLGFVDVLTYISTKSLMNNNQNLLRLYERYVKTGSSLARDQLLEKGIVTSDSVKKTYQ
ncbi:MAG: hypothetical protein AB7F59_00900 [Bdellovibrionales bacterium]